MWRSFLFLFLFIVPFYALSQNSPFEFNKISNTNGLSNNSINCIFQDSYGFIWFGTLNGLNRFDGNDFLVFHNDTRNKASISNDIITSIQEDKNKRLWIGTASGLNIYDPTTEKFQNYNNNPDQNKALTVRSGISTVYATNRFIWIGTRDRRINNSGLYRFDQQTQVFDPNPLGNFNLVDKKINSICEDKDHHLWIGTSKGLNRLTYNTITNKAITLDTYYNNISDASSISNNKINTIYKDHNNDLWIGTSNGLNKLVYTTGTSTAPLQFIR
jgi:ligand-binding sensor domain-containing protein